MNDDNEVIAVDEEKAATSGMKENVDAIEACITSSPFFPDVAVTAATVWWLLMTDKEDETVCNNDGGGGGPLELLSVVLQAAAAFKRDDEALSAG